MDSAPPVAVRSLRKEFLINTAATTSLKEMVIRNLFAKAETVLHTALEDVSFTIEPGTCLAVVGGNGSGKSTLLKILSGISQPTSGSVEVHGRLSALLELGAGFQQEFTGMENIFLQCSIMGLQRPRILERLDAIIAFSELDKFIHTPVKHYSSGMYVRLGFAIAVHVDADVILLDEVLAVGDRSFQTKCLRKMRELRRAGAAMLFVSHNLEHIEAIADQVLWLEGGRVREHGSAADALPKFFEALQQGPNAQEEVELDLRRAAALPAARFKSSEAKMTAVRFLGADGQPRRTFDVEESVIIEMDVLLARNFDVLEVQFGLSTMDAVRAVWVRSRREYRNLAAGAHRLTLELSDIHLRPGRHLASTMLGDPADDAVIYDMHVRTYAISLKGAPELHDAEGRLTPFGSFIG